MNSTGHNGEKTGYRVILLLVVGLTAFSSAMKELNQVQQLSLDASRLIAQWSHKVVPAEIPQTVVKLESCEIQQSAPSVELPWLSNVAEETEPAPGKFPKIDIEPPVVAPRASPRKVRRVNIDPVQLEVRISPDRDAEPDVEVITSELPLTMFKAKARRHGAIRINPRDREMILKTANRSINLRIAS